ncbi:hypothetical protein JTE90_013253 [Oedothorax gibbosus]|uniref:Uncharacterized protein n=1 Tax=Oedothorax gibbosus TaxID=931172 RepID=A0AAV6VCY9_9ARAC|nr:hypothetical protein JTE90_013253 [Oedothorax gibbosus]
MEVATSDPLLFKTSMTVNDIIDNAFKSGYRGEYTVVLSGGASPIPRSYPKLLKDNLNKKITNPRKILNIKHTKQNNILIKTEDPTTAKELLSIKLLISIPVKADLNLVNITSRFALHDIPPDIPLTECIEELEAENNLKVIECRSDSHDQSRCKNSPKCVNCEGQHEANSDDCPKKLQKKNFLTYKCLNRLSFAEARSSFKSNTSPPRAVHSQPPMANYITKQDFETTILQLQSSFESTIVKALNAQAASMMSMLHTMFQQLTPNLSPLPPQLPTVPDPVTVPGLPNWSPIPQKSAIVKLVRNSSQFNG